MFVIKAAVLMLSGVCFLSLLLAAICCYVTARNEDRVRGLEDRMESFLKESRA